ncbi:MAG: Ig-like domain-containing protein [Blastocatellia bacterium]
MAVEVTGLNPATLQQLAKWTPAQLQRVLAMYSGKANANLPPMLGKYQIQNSTLRFEPQFPPEPGVTYRAVYLSGQLPGGSGNSVITATFTPPPRDLTPTTAVSQIYPSSDIVPENLLKFYVHFSAPMQRGSIYEHIRLLNEAGKVIELPFLEVDEELWNQDFTRLTLFIDPGRIKRGVKPLEEIGPSMEAGKSYRLVIDRQWLDGKGAPLKASFEKAFRVAAADRQPPDPASWQIKAPTVGAREALTITFPEPMEHALISRMIVVTTATGETVFGTVALENQERRWTLTPDAAWQRGKYNIIIQTTIEDLAGNNIGKPFEVDVFNSVQRHLTSQTVKLTFEIR